jgi:glycerophosphoryl diester phosphodiesterase
MNSFDTQGHRGCRGLMPENTIPAMLKALDLGVITLELDAVITKDKEVVVSHEPFFNHEISLKPDGKPVTPAEEQSLNIYQMTYDEVKAFDVGSKPHPRFPDQQKLRVSKPLLRELLDSTETSANQKGRKLFYNIETKSAPRGDNTYHPAPPEFVDLLMGVIQSKELEERVIIQSFDFRTLQYLHDKYPAIKTAMLIEDNNTRSLDDQLQSLGFIPTIYSPHYSLVTAVLIQKCHEKGIKVIPWTVNTLKRMEKLKAMGVDGIISDYPNLFQQL